MALKTERSYMKNVNESLISDEDYMDYIVISLCRGLRLYDANEIMQDAGGGTGDTDSERHC